MYMNCCTKCKQNIIINKVWPIEASHSQVVGSKELFNRANNECKMK